MQPLPHEAQRASLEALRDGLRAQRERVEAQRVCQDVQISRLLAQNFRHVPRRVLAEARNVRSVEHASFRTKQQLLGLADRVRGVRQPLPDRLLCVNRAAMGADDVLRDARAVPSRANEGLLIHQYRRDAAPSPEHGVACLNVWRRAWKRAPKVRHR